ARSRPPAGRREARATSCFRGWCWSWSPFLDPIASRAVRGACGSPGCTRLGEPSLNGYTDPDQSSTEHDKQARIPTPPERRTADVFADVDPPGHGAGPV